MSRTYAPTVDIYQHNGTDKGLKLAGTLVTSTAAELNALDGVTSSAAELNYLDIATLGTGAASKAVVLSASSNYTSPGAGTWAFASGSTVNIAGTFQIGGVTVGSTAAEIDQICDASASSDTRTGAGAISIDKAYTSLVTTGADALTLAAPGAASIPRVKVIHMTTDGGDGTLASTNIVGQSSGTTSITFNDAGDYLVLVSVPGLNKWSVLKEGGVTAA